MPNLDHFLRFFSNPTSSSAEKQLLKQEFSSLLFKHALKNIQDRAATYGIAENNSIEHIDGKMINGLMQPLYESTIYPEIPNNSVGVNVTVNAFFTGENSLHESALNVAELSDLIAQDKFQATDFNGFVLACVAKCDAINLVNPYSNPFYYGSDLFQNLWPVTVTYVPFIYVPVINNKLYVEIIKQYYQPELHRFVGSIMREHLDCFTPLYYRHSRNTQLLYDSLKLYKQLAGTVAELFSPTCKEQIRVRIYYCTVFRYMPEAIKSLCNWMQQVMNDAPMQQEMIPQYNAQIDKFAEMLNECVATVQDYINNLDNNPYWRFEQERVHNPDSFENINLPLQPEDKELLVRKTLLSLVNMHRQLQDARRLLGTFVDGLALSTLQPKLIFPKFVPLGESGGKWALDTKIYYFIDGLIEAIRNITVRTKILNVLNRCFINQYQFSLNNNILTDSQLLNIYMYVLNVLQNAESLERLRVLAPESAPETNIDSMLVFTRSTARGKLRDPLLIRTVIITRKNDEFKLSMVPNRKGSDGTHLLPKFKGHVTSVTPQFDISPAHAEKLDPPQASKSIDLCYACYNKNIPKQVEMFSKTLKEEEDKVNLAVEIARKMGRQVIFSNKYVHFKKNGDANRGFNSGYRYAMRVTEDWAIGTLRSLIKGEINKSDTFLKNDVVYAAAVLNSNQQVVTEAKQKIIYRIIEDILYDLVKLHYELNVIHRDIKPENILLYVDEVGELRARLADFDMSIYLNNANNGQPVATGNYASPQVVGFTLITELKSLIYSDLQGDLLAKNLLGKFEHVCYGRELFYLHDTAESRVDYIGLKPDFSDDMFSLGVTLFMLLSGGYYPTEIEFERSTGEKKFMLTQTFYSLRTEFKDLIKGMLQLERGQRLNACDALNMYHSISSSARNSFGLFAQKVAPNFVV